MRLFFSDISRLVFLSSEEAPGNAGQLSTSWRFSRLRMTVGFPGEGIGNVASGR